MVEDAILLKNNERDSLEAELRVLRSKLQANTSDVGDWKIIKALEYQLVNEDIPYDITELNKERQSIRNRINEIDIRLNELEGEINELMIELAAEIEAQREAESEQETEISDEATDEIVNEDDVTNADSIGESESSPTE